MVTHPSIDLNAPPPDGPHYLLAVTDMAERCPVVAHSAIYNDSGIKLVEKGRASPRACTTGWCSTACRTGLTAI